MKKYVKENLNEGKKSLNETTKVWDNSKIRNAFSANEVFSEFDKLALMMKRHENFVGKKAMSLWEFLKFIDEYEYELKQIKKEIETYLQKYSKNID